MKENPYIPFVQGCVQRVAFFSLRILCSIGEKSIKYLYLFFIYFYFRGSSNVHDYNEGSRNCGSEKSGFKREVEKERKKKKNIESGWLSWKFYDSGK